MTRYKHFICGIIGICAAMAVTGLLIQKRIQFVEAKAVQAQEGLAEEVFRFHVLANSDSGEDQNVKLKVRDAVLEYMKDNMEDEAGGTKAGEPSADDTKEWAQAHLDELQLVAEEELRENGFSYGAEAVVTNCYFPEKRYGDITFPEGEYEALRIKLGEAGGHNWWCVLYPNLCFIDTTCAVVSEEGKKDLKEALSAEEYEMVTASEDFKIKWFFFGGDEEKK